MRCYSGVSEATQPKFENDRIYNGYNTNSFMTEDSEMNNYPNRGNTGEPFENFRKFSSSSFSQSNVETASHVSSWLQHSTSLADQVNSNQDKVVKTEKLQNPINKHHHGLP